MLLSLEKGFLKVCLLQKEEQNQEWDRQLGELSLLGAYGEHQLPHMWPGDPWRTAGMPCQCVKVEMVHLSMAWGNGSLGLQGVDGTPELKSPGRTKRRCSGVPQTRVKNVPQSCEESLSSLVIFIHG